MVEAVAPDGHRQPGGPDDRPVLGADVEPVRDHHVGADRGDGVGELAAVQRRVGPVRDGDVGLGPHLDVGAERLQADQVAAHVLLARLRVVPFGEQHPEALGGLAAAPVAEDAEVRVQRQCSR